MPEIHESTLIPGVKRVILRAFGDDRGRFMETFRSEWFPERAWSIIQTNRSESRAGTLRGLHYHFHQVDYWHLVAGRARVGLADLRPGSPGYGRSEVVELDGAAPSGLLIPVGVAHGFYALSDVVLTYLVDNYYDGADELGVAWDDPDLAVAWGVGETAPMLSPRDAANQPWRALHPDHLPRT